MNSQPVFINELPFMNNIRGDQEACIRDQYLIETKNNVFVQCAKLWFIKSLKQLK